MRTIGFISDVHELHKRNFNHKNARVWRFVPMSEYCSQHNAEVFVYSRYHINSKTKLAYGYIVKNKKFIPVIRKIPKVNGEWFYNSLEMPNRSGLNKRAFNEWIKKNNIYIYPSAEFSGLVNDKYKSYEIINLVDGTVQPYTEKYNNSSQQIERMLAQKSKLFFKATHGTQGENIFVVNKIADKITLSHYKNKTVKDYDINKIEDVVNIINKNKIKNDYVIQHGIDVIQYKNTSLLIRSILLDDGENWHSVSKAVTASVARDVANTTQGSANHTIDEVFHELFADEAEAYKIKLDKLCKKLITYLAEKYDRQLMEVAFDFSIDKNNNFILLEMDNHPGIKKPGMKGLGLFENIFKPDEKQKVVYDKYLKPHGELLAKFLLLQDKIKEK